MDGGWPAIGDGRGLREPRKGKAAAEYERRWDVEGTMADEMVMRRTVTTQRTAK